MEMMDGHSPFGSSLKDMLKQFLFKCTRQYCSQYACNFLPYVLNDPFAIPLVPYVHHIG